MSKNTVTLNISTAKSEKYHKKFDCCELTSFFLSDGGEEPSKPLTDLTIAPLHPRDKGTSNAVARVPGVPGTSLDSNFSTMMSTSAVTLSARGAGKAFRGWRLRSRQIEGKGTS